MSRAVVVIAHYDARPLAPLLRLLDGLAAVPAGGPFSVRVVVQQTRARLPTLPARHAQVEVLGRPNHGFNLGAWEHGRRGLDDARFVLFLQDEVELVRGGWWTAIDRALSDPAVGLLGECWATPWEAPWGVLTARFPGRASAYRQRLLGWGIPPGATGAHQQALVWAARPSTLRAIGGIRTGITKDEAIAAEIATSKAVEASGLQVRGMHVRPFRWFLHPQWRRRTVVSRVPRAPLPPHEVSRWQSARQLRPGVFGRAAVWAVLGDASEWDTLGLWVAGLRLRGIPVVVWAPRRLRREVDAPLCWVAEGALRDGALPGLRAVRALLSVGEERGHLAHDLARRFRGPSFTAQGRWAQWSSAPAASKVAFVWGRPDEHVLPAGPRIVTVGLLSAARPGRSDWVEVDGLDGAAKLGRWGVGVGVRGPRSGPLLDARQAAQRPVWEVQARTRAWVERVLFPGDPLGTMCDRVEAVWRSSGA